ncbi:DNA modification system-associated small protein [Magnetovibrio sp.]|uniref:DNA modification system-associated small protein n=1 Tax=Magnetovibrio sp. TaxID=2024836 RepID=UPI002F942193
MDDEALVDDGYLSDLPLWQDDDARAILEKVCAEFDVPVDVITELVTLQREKQHQERAAGSYARIEEIIGRID